MSRFFIGYVVAGLVMLPFAAGAADSASSDVNAQLRAMQQRMSQMEDRLEATTDKLDNANQRLNAQTDLIHRAKLDQDSQSGVAAFLDTLEIGGWIAGGWNYNFHNPGGSNAAGANAGNLGFYPFHPDANTFSVDQAWFSLSRPTSEENRAGFQLDLVVGKTAALLNSLGYLGQSGSSFEFHMYQAYIEYLAPIGPHGVTIQAGKMGTWIGKEVAQTVDNFNITRGNVYTLFQPITNVGIRAETELGGGVTVGAGVVNGTRSDADTEFTSTRKAVVWKVAWSNDTFGAQFAGTHGQTSDATFFSQFHASNGSLGSSQKETIYDLIFTWDPNEKFSGYINADYINSENNARSLVTSTAAMFGAPFLGDEVRGYGVAVGGRYAINERMGIALRGEWVDLDRKVFQNVRIYGITGTLDYALTEHLKVRGEMRYDNSGSMNNAGPAGMAPFPKAFCGGRSSTCGTSYASGNSNSGGENNQLTTGVEVIYSF